ncbi:hypothetical protein CLV83_0508 [Marinobacterium mangrovicola]|uniref:Uncharacterized protein n=1 Tax=Marinobacterium mangrovicola TaxID=1476959 RepID=A0A4R1GJ78_9GAMM|nr:hypothetical protein CLV83_0508 [Marinobacterium mangrovicola]
MDEKHRRWFEPSADGARRRRATHDGPKGNNPPLTTIEFHDKASPNREALLFLRKAKGG